MLIAIIQKFLFASRVKEIERLPKPGAGLKRSSSSPQWVSSKKRNMNLGDVQVRRKGAGSSTQPSNVDAVTGRLGLMTTRDEPEAEEGETD